MNIKPYETTFSELNAKWMAKIANLAQSNIGNLLTAQAPTANAADLVAILDEAFDLVEQHNDGQVLEKIEFEWLGAMSEQQWDAIARHINGVA